MIMESHALFFLIFCHSVWPMWYVGSWLPDKESNGQPLHSKCRILATGLPGKSHILKLLNMYLNVSEWLPVMMLAETLWARIKI